MEKKYKLKEEVKKYLCESLHNEIRYEGYWMNERVSKEALEEVPQRVELEIMGGRYYAQSLQKKDFSIPFTEQEKELCEKALNGELHTLDQVLSAIENWSVFGIDKKTIEEYLNQKK